MDISHILDNVANAVIVAVVGGVGAAICFFGKKIWKKIKKQLKKRGNLKKYYKYVTNNLDEEEKPALVGDRKLSNNEVYIDAYSIGDGENEHGEKILDTIEQWSKEKSSGVMLIHGEPGHGKTTLCRKAVYESHRNKFSKKKSNVFWFRLNPAYSDIIDKDGELVLENAFCWGNIKSQKKLIPLEEYEKEYTGSIIFLDGYDELKVQLHRNDLSLANFIDSAEQLARRYHMHIIITTRTRSLDDEFVSSSIKKLQFALMSEEQQNKWIEKNAPRYKEDFEVLRVSSKKMKEMLGIPILFRMVVQAQLRSTTAKNVVDLYDTLFEATMLRRKMKGRNIEDCHKKYEQLAYEIYCNDETFANMRGKELPEDFLYLFYLKGNGEKRVEFLHRSFYQYFLAHFLYRKMSAVENTESAEAFLCCLAEQRIDNDVLNYIRQVQEKKCDVMQEECKQIINTLEQTGMIIGRTLNAPDENENTEEHQLLRCENVLTNALNICCTIAAIAGREFIISLRKKENIHAAMRRYNCSRIWLKNVDLSGANLTKANLTKVDLNIVNLSGANLSRAALVKANLIGANLSRADLTGANLTGADLLGADLRWVNNLSGCNCERVYDWSGCRILLRDRDNLGLDNPDAHGIIWCDNETGKPIKSHDYDIACYDDDGNLINP